MRKLNKARCVSLACLILAPLCMMAQVQSPEDYSMFRTRAQDGLRGSVKSCRLETTIPALPGASPEIRTESTTEYDREGRVSGSRDLQSDGGLWITRYEYSPSGQLLKIASGTQGKTQSVTSYIYDDHGRIQRIAPDKPGQGPFSFQPISFHYDERGRKTSTVSSSASDYRPEVATGGGPFDGLNFPPNLPGGGTSTTIYDEHDRPTEVETRDSNGELVMHATRTYDPQGRVMDEKEIHDNLVSTFSPEAHEKVLQDSGLSSEQFATLLQTELPKLMGGHSEAYPISYSYDAHGRVSHTSRRIFNRQDEIDTTYNDHGDVEIEITRSTQTPAADGSRPNPGESPYSEVRYSYQYDDYGNWTEKTTSYRSNSDENFQPSSTIKRTLTYY